MEYALTKRRAAGWLAGWLLLVCSAHGAEPTARPRETPPTHTARVQTAPRSDPLRLKPQQRRPSTTRQRIFGGTSLVRLGSRLAVVLGLFGSLVMVQRWLGGSRGSTLPTDVIQVYGRVPLSSKQHLLLVRVGERLLILLESAQGISRLAEITDPAEVSRLVERFRQDQAPGAAGLAREFLGQMGIGESQRRV